MYWCSYMLLLLLFVFVARSLCFSCCFHFLTCGGVGELSFVAAHFFVFHCPPPPQLAAALTTYVRPNSVCFVCECFCFHIYCFSSVLCVYSRARSLAAITKQQKKKKNKRSSQVFENTALAMPVNGNKIQQQKLGHFMCL